jgi:hypothetical protein
VLSLDGQWLECTVMRRREWLWIGEDETKIIKSGMSGSPIVSRTGHAIGLLSSSGSGGSLNPVLVEALLPRLGLS